MDDEERDELPVLMAVSSSARQLYMLLRCINFADKAHVQISEEGLKFSVNEASSVEGSAFLDKSLFTTYTYHAPTTPTSTTGVPAPFQISLPSLLETLQILTLTDPATARPPWRSADPTYPTATSTAAVTAFTNTLLGLPSTCRISYHGLGSPLSLILTENTIRTTCNLTTYEPEYSGLQEDEDGNEIEIVEDKIPFDRTRLAFKTIMRGSWLSDAVTELASTTPESLTLVARMARTAGGSSEKGGEKTPYFALSASGPLGSARVEFNPSSISPANATKRPRSHAAPTSTLSTTTPNPAPSDTPTSLLETFQLTTPSGIHHTYAFRSIARALRAMALSAKVSIRTDEQGVLSLQFMIEVEAESKKVSFVDFRFVPLVDGEGEGEGDETMVGDGESGEGSETEDE